MAIHNLEWNPENRAMQKKTNVNSVDHDPSKEVAVLHANQKAPERKIESLTNSLHAMQVGCENCKGP